MTTKSDESAAHELLLKMVQGGLCASALNIKTLSAPGAIIEHMRLQLSETELRMLAQLNADYLNHYRADTALLALSLKTPNNKD